MSILQLKFDFKAVEEGEISVSKGELVKVIEEKDDDENKQDDVNDGWICVETLAPPFRSGYVPESYVKSTESDESRKMSPAGLGVGVAPTKTNPTMPQLTPLDNDYKLLVRNMTERNDAEFARMMSEREANLSQSREDLKTIQKSLLEINNKTLDLGFKLESLDEFVAERRKESMLRLEMDEMKINEKRAGITRAIVFEKTS